VALFGFASNYLPLPTGETWLAATIPTHGSATAVPRGEFGEMPGRVAENNAARQLDAARAGARRRSKTCTARRKS
jgi:hypothetical protein